MEDEARIAVIEALRESERALSARNLKHTAHWEKMARSAEFRVDLALQKLGLNKPRTRHGTDRFLSGE